MIGDPAVLPLVSARNAFATHEYNGMRLSFLEISFLVRIFCPDAIKCNSAFNLKLERSPLVFLNPGV